MKNDLNRVAESIRGAFTTGTPYTMPLLTVRELGQVLDMLRASEQKKAA